MSSRDTDAPTGEGISDDSYVSRSGNKSEPLNVVSDSERIDEPTAQGDQDSDAQLEKDDKDAIDRDNIIEERTRGAAKEAGTYREPGDEEGLPGPEDGTSQGRQ